MNPWPFPGEGRLVRARRIAVAYRVALNAINPAECQRLDAQFTAWGETWCIPRVVTYDPDQWLPPKDAADVACISTDTLRQLRARGRIDGRLVDGHYEYQVRDLWKLSVAPRSREAGVTDTLPTSGTRVPEA